MKADVDGDVAPDFNFPGGPGGVKRDVLAVPRVPRFKRGLPLARRVSTAFSFNGLTTKVYVRVLTIIPQNLAEDTSETYSMGLPREYLVNFSKMDVHVSLPYVRVYCHCREVDHVQYADAPLHEIKEYLKKIVHTRFLNTVVSL